MKLEGKTCLVTGANSGLGFATAKRFAAQGAHVILVCRDTNKVEASIQAIHNEVPQAVLDGLTADLSSIRSVKKLVEKVKQNYPLLDILFNNAAVVKMERTVTPESFETMFATNYLAPFVLSTGLVEILKKAEHSQIINIAVPSDKFRLSFDDLQSEHKFNSFNSLFNSKLCLLLSSLELSTRLEGSGVSVNCIDPGPFRSNLSREAPGLLRWMMGLVSSSSENASRFIEYLAEKTDQVGMTGKVFVKEKEKTLTDYWQDTAVREKLWNETESLVSRINPQ